MILPNKLFVSQTAPDKLDVVNENYPNATKYVRLDEVVEFINSQMADIKNGAKSALNAGYLWALQDVADKLDRM